MPFSMEVANVAEIKNEVIEQVKPVPEEVAKLQALAESNVSEILALDLDSLDKKREILKSIESFGADSMRNSAQKNSLLQISVGNLSKEGDEGGYVAKGLTELHRELKDLDPSAIDFTKTGLLGKIFNPVRASIARVTT